MVFTIGHSTRTPEEFLAVLARHGIRTIADVRRFPGSRRHPQFGKDALATLLATHGIEYHWIESLGGRRRVGDAPENAWRNASFRAYAGHIDTPEFATGLAELLAHANRGRTAMMCAELLWWRCHRRIIADVLTARGIRVLHIAAEKKPDEHSLTAPARLVDGRLSYAAEPSSALGNPGHVG